VTQVFKILTRADWEAASTAGVFTGAAVDLKDGFIHLSAEEQWRETLRLHFADQRDLVLVEFDAEALGPALKWEPSRGGALFPHLYGPLPTALAVSIQPVAAGGGA